MFQSKVFWQCLLMPGSLIGWVFVFAGYFCEFGGYLKILWYAICAIWLVVHPLEIFISYKIGKEKNIAIAMIIIKTILFGFTWWLPLKKGILEK